MNKLRQLWNRADGYKTIIGTGLGVVYLGAVSMGLIERNETIEIAIFTIFGVGVGHRVVKRK